VTSCLHPVRACENCGELFTPGAANQRFHSVKCRRRARQKRLRDAAGGVATGTTLTAVCETCSGRFEYVVVASRRRHCFTCRPPQPPSVGQRLCARCGEPSTSPRHRYCDACRVWAEEQRSRRVSTVTGGKLRRRPPRACEVCGEPYVPTYGPQRTCGRACGLKLRRRAAA
jgi:hypothetical protein